MMKKEKCVKVYVVTFEKEDEFETIGVYSNEELANNARQERAAEEDPGEGEFTISVEELEIDA
jgi:hypothetical protein